MKSTGKGKWYLINFTRGITTKKREYTHNWKLTSFIKIVHKNVNKNEIINEVNLADMFKQLAQGSETWKPLDMQEFEHLCVQLHV